MPSNYKEILSRTLKILDKNGELSKFLPSYEIRPGQREMAKIVFETIAQEGIAIIEAGTGTGKTLAYLIPAIFFAKALNEPVIISTRTINLQEQILFKDIPLLKKIIKEEFKAELVKGWNNYLCLRRLKNIENSQETFDIEEFKCYKKILQWIKETKNGDYSHINFIVPNSLWELICAESSACMGRRCPWFNKCYFFSQRKNLKNSDILITNHALLFTYIANKRKSIDNTSAILPDFSRLIMDEAHHIEEIASDFLGDEASSKQFFKTIDNLFSFRRKKEEIGLLARIRTTLFSPSLTNKIRTMLDSYSIPRLNNLREIASDFFYKVSRLSLLEKNNDKIKLDSPFKDKSIEVKEEFNRLTKEIVQYIKGLKALREECERENEDLSLEISSIINKMEIFLDSFIKIWESEEKDWIYSMEYSRNAKTDYVRFKSYPLKISNILYNELFTPLKATILTSATLSINKNFKFFCQRLGLDKFDENFVRKNIIESPFDYKKQALLAIPQDTPLAKDKNFIPMVTPHIIHLIKIMKGRTFLLFTSYSMLKECGSFLKEKLKKDKFNIFIQGESPRSLLLKNFKNYDKSVLLGTDSFWEGVDVPGKNLECIIIMKLPFRVPTEPIIEARTEYIKSQGMNPFLHYHVPQAVIRFKQGFGRLIRNRKDKGVVIILDKRITQRNYGKAFLKSLPRIKMIKGSFAATIKCIEKWYHPH